MFPTLSLSVGYAIVVLVQTGRGARNPNPVIYYCLGTLPNKYGRISNAVNNS